MRGTNVPILEPNLYIAFGDAQLAGKPLSHLIVGPRINVEPVLQHAELLRRCPPAMLDFKVSVQHGSSGFIELFLPVSHGRSKPIVGNVRHHLREPRLRSHRRIIGRVGLSGDRVLCRRHEALRNLRSSHLHGGLLLLLLQVNLRNAFDRLAHGRLTTVAVHLHRHLHLRWWWWWRWLLLLRLSGDPRLAHSSRICDLLAAVWGKPNLLHEGKRLNGQYRDKLSLLGSGWKEFTTG